MVTNPLQQYFRQPKIYISLPSKGMFNQPGTLQGDATNLPVCGMTGMDEIILKTPDALLSGESSVKVIESCCSGIKDAWSLASIDTTALFTAIRIATYGNTMTVINTCTNCSTENEYDIDLNKIIEHFARCTYNSRIELGEIVINTRPMTYKEMTEFNLRNFQLQQKLSQAEKITDQEKQQEMINQMFLELAVVRNEIYIASIDSIETKTATVTERDFIAEYVTKCDKFVFDEISKHIDQGRTDWQSPSFPVECSHCQTAANVRVELDQSNFFV